MVHYTTNRISNVIKYDFRLLNAPFLAFDLRPTPLQADCIFDVRVSPRSSLQSIVVTSDLCIACGGLKRGLPQRELPVVDDPEGTIISSSDPQSKPPIAGAGQIL